MGLEFLKKPPKWGNMGAEPPEDLKKKGFTAGYKPPAGYFNWFWNRAGECMEELQAKLKTLSKGDIGLSQVDNTADKDKPVSAAAQAELEKKVDKITGKQLSTNDYTAADKSKLSSITSGAEANVQSDWAVADTGSDSYIKNKPISLPANGGNAATVNNHTVNTDVPDNAKFTDTVYSVATTVADGLMSRGDKGKLDGIAVGANNYDHPAAHPASMINYVDNKGVGGTNLQTVVDLVADKVLNQLMERSKLSNNLTTTVGGFALDARMGKTLQDQIDATNNNFAELSTRIDELHPKPTYLYNVGDECVALTGGWAQGGDGGTVTKNVNNIVLGVTTNATVVMHTVKKIDITCISEIIVTGSFVAGYDCGIALLPNTISDYSNANRVTINKSAQGDIIRINTTALSGSYYVLIHAYLSAKLTVERVTCI